jgi:glycosyltransferase involved in cell wall biosynthesis
MSVSILILTLNEETNIAACMDSLSWSDDIVVLDSLSTDGTQRIAEEHGARIVTRAFDDWSSHQNWAVNNIEFRHPWVLYIDADERCPAELRELYPTWFVRLFRPSRIRYERLVNPIAVVDGPIGELQEHITHYPFSHGISHWIARHNRYSDLEAVEAAKLRGAARPEGQLWSSDPNERRRALKNVFFKLPARPALKFLYYYCWRRGFLDGRAGLSYASLQAIYEYMIECKSWELERRRRGLPV